MKKKINQVDRNEGGKLGGWKNLIMQDVFPTSMTRVLEVHCDAIKKANYKSRVRDGKAFCLEHHEIIKSIERVTSICIGQERCKSIDCILKVVCYL